LREVAQASKFLLLKKEQKRVNGQKVGISQKPHKYYLCIISNHMNKKFALSVVAQMLKRMATNKVRRCFAAAIAASSLLQVPA